MNETERLLRACVAADDVLLPALESRIKSQDARIAKLKECAAVLRELVSVRVTEADYRYGSVMNRAEQALAALDKEQGNVS